MTEGWRVAIVGGGLAGLAAAHRLLERAATVGRHLEVVLFEASPRLGGVVRTVRRDGYLIEEGPDSLLPERPDTMGLLERLGLASRLVAVRPQARRSFVIHNRRPVALPVGFVFLAPAALWPFLASRLLSPRGKLRVVLEPLLPPRRDPSDESVADFARRRFGGEFYQAIAEPMICGLYGVDPAELSMQASLPRLASLEREFGSVLRGLARARHDPAGAPGSEPRRGLVSFDRGMETLVEALSAALGACELRLATPVHGVAPLEGGGLRVSSARGEEPFAAVLLALPAPAAASLFAAADPALATLLRSIPYHSSSTLTLAFGPGAMPDGGASGGFASRREGFLLRALTASHAKFEGRAPAGAALLRLSYGEDADALSDREIAARAVFELSELFPLRGQPLFVHRARHEGARPHYRVGHVTLVARIRARARIHRGLTLAGSAYDGVGIPDVLASGARVADEIWEGMARA